MNDNWGAPILKIMDFQNIKTINEGLKDTVKNIRKGVVKNKLMETIEEIEKTSDALLQGIDFQHINVSALRIQSWAKNSSPVSYEDAVKWMETQDKSYLSSETRDAIIKAYQITRGAVKSVEIKDECRASYASGAARIKISFNERPIAILHEMAHGLEDRFGFSHTSKALIKRRCSDPNSSYPLREVQDESIALSLYDEHERYFRDAGFMSPYTAKDYGRGATEVVSMGVENFISVDNLTNLMINDFEHFHYVFSILYATGKKG